MSLYLNRIRFLTVRCEKIKDPEPIFPERLNLDPNPIHIKPDPKPLGLHELDFVLYRLTSAVPWYCQHWMTWPGFSISGVGQLSSQCVTHWPVNLFQTTSFSSDAYPFSPLKGVEGGGCTNKTSAQRINDPALNCSGEQERSRHGDAYHAAGVTGPSEDVTREKGSTEKGWLQRGSRP